MGIAAKLGEYNIRFKATNQRRHYLVECPKIDLIIGIRGEGNIHRIPLACTNPYL
jgi:hypothetical protein